MSEEEIFKLDGVSYPINDLSDNGKAILKSLRFVEQELAQQQARIAVLNTAKAAYISSLQTEVSTTSD